MKHTITNILLLAIAMIQAAAFLTTRGTPRPTAERGVQHVFITNDNLPVSATTPVPIEVQNELLMVHMQNEILPVSVANPLLEVLVANKRLGVVVANETMPPVIIANKGAIPVEIKAHSMSNLTALPVRVAN